MIYFDKGVIMFEPNKLPPVLTYVERYDRSWLEYGVKRTLDQTLQTEIENIGTLTIVSSNSKMGKSSLLKRNLTKAKYIEISGQELLNINIYQLLSNKLGLLSMQKKTNKTGIKLLSVSEEVQYDINLKSNCIKCLIENKITVLIDDFHYLPEEQKRELSFELKSLIEQVKVIITTHPNKKHELTGYNPDLNGRVEIISITLWADQEIREIYEKGFGSSKYPISPELIDYCVKKAINSPQIAQQLGYSLTTVFPDFASRVEIDICLKQMAKKFNHMKLVNKIEDEKRGKPTIYKLESNQELTISFLLLECLKEEPQCSAYSDSRLLEIASKLTVNKQDITIDKIRRGMRNIEKCINDSNIIEVIDNQLFVYDITLLFYLKYA